MQFLWDTVRITKIGSEIIPQWIELIKHDLFQYLMLEGTVYVLITANVDFEVQNFIDNPIEFINANRSDKEDWDTLKNSIIDFISVVISPIFSKRASSRYIDELLQFWVSHIQSTFDSWEVSYKVKDGLLVLLASLSPALVACDSYYNDLNKLFEILSGFTGDSMLSIERNILIYRILNLFEEYSMMDWETPTIK